MYDQSYATAASKIGTAVIWEQSLENGHTSALFPDLLVTVAWQPTIAMLVWDSNWVEVILSSSSSTEVVIAQITLILAYKFRFGKTLISPLADDPGQWGARSDIQPVVFLLLDPIAANLDLNLSIMDASVALATELSTSSAELAVDAAPTAAGLTRLAAEDQWIFVSASMAPE